MARCWTPRLVARAAIVSLATVWAGDVGAQPAFPTPEPPADAIAGEPTPPKESEEASDSDQDEAHRRALDPAPVPPTAGPPLHEGRDKPNYDGREPEKTTVGEALQWVPRVILFPAYLVTEYLVRWPLGQAISGIEKYHVIEYVKEIFTFRDGTIGVFPIFRIDRGTVGTVGLYSFADGPFIDLHDMRLSGDTDFIRNHNLVLLNRLELLEEDLKLSLRLSLEKRDDFVFYGTGADTKERRESRFGRRKLMALVKIAYYDEKPGFDGWLSFEVSTNEFFCTTSNGPTLCGPDHKPLTADDLHPIDTRDGAAYFSNGYNLVRLKLNAALDSRRQRPAAGSGARLELFGRWGHGGGSASRDIHFLRYGGEASLFWDITGRQRVLSLRSRVELVEPVSHGHVPFAELITLGGIETMRGFLHARFHGRSAFVATFDYRYPVWAFLDGNVFFEVGNTFGDRFEDFSFDWLRAAWGIGLKTNASRDVSFDFLFALGTSPLGVGKVRVDFVRLAVGTNLGF